MTIGSNIKQIRKEKKLTQSDLAKKINKGLRTVQKYESKNLRFFLQMKLLWKMCCVKKNMNSAFLKSVY